MRQIVKEWWPIFNLLGGLGAMFVLMTTNLLFHTPAGWVFVASIVSGIVMLIAGSVEAVLDDNARDDVLMARILFAACFAVPALARLIGG